MVSRGKPLVFWKKFECAEYRECKPCVRSELGCYVLVWKNCVNQKIPWVTKKLCGTFQNALDCLSVPFATGFAWDATFV